MIYNKIRIPLLKIGGVNNRPLLKIEGDPF